MIVGNVGESRLLNRFLPDLIRRASDRVVVPPGDDAAVLQITNKDPWVVTTDTLVEDVHFRTRWTHGRDLGHKALAVNLSDLAAMGDVQPLFGLISLGISRKTTVDYVDNFYKGAQKLTQKHGFEIVGGDTVRSDKILVSVTAIGKMRRGARPILRSGARVGDCLLVTGTLGDARAGFEVVEKRPASLSPGMKHFLKDRFLRPEPKLTAARRLARGGGVTALMDSSDGFYRSVEIICEASRVGAEVFCEDLPISAALREWTSQVRRSATDYALVGGEDYELVLTASPGAARRLARHGWARIVGRMVPRGRGIVVSENDQKRRVPIGFEHFR